MFDQLDLGLSRSDNNYALRLIGLLLAAKELNNAARNKVKKLTVAVFLRGDIYGYLKFEDKNKITENNMAPVFWDHGPNHRTLKGLMESRFRVVMDSDEVTWPDLFDEEHQMTGRQSKYNYMRDRTFLRPRDMIKFCNETLSVSKVAMVGLANSKTGIFLTLKIFIQIFYLRNSKMKFISTFLNMRFIWKF